MNDKKIIIVDKEDTFVGKETYIKIHDEKILHRSTKVLIFNEKDELLIVKRSKHKKLWPKVWESSCSAHVYENETYVHAGERKIKKNLGFYCQLKPFLKFSYTAKYKNKKSENEICNVLIGKFSGHVNLDFGEVTNFKWISITNLKREIKKNPKKYVPWLKLILNKYSQNKKEVRKLKDSLIPFYDKKEEKVSKINFKPIYYKTLSEIGKIVDVETDVLHKEIFLRYPEKKIIYEEMLKRKKGTQKLRAMAAFLAFCAFNEKIKKPNKIISKLLTAVEMENYSNYELNWMFDEKGSIKKDTSYLIELKKAGLATHGFIQDALYMVSKINPIYVDIFLEINDRTHRGWTPELFDLNFKNKQLLNDFEYFWKSYKIRNVEAGGQFYDNYVKLAYTYSGKNNKKLYVALKQIFEEFGEYVQILNDLGDFAPPGTIILHEKKESDQLSDLRHGLITWPVWLVYNRASGKDKDFLRSIPNKKNLTNKDYYKFMKLLYKTKTFDDIYSSLRTKAHYLQRALDGLDIDYKTKCLLKSMITILDCNKLIYSFKKFKDKNYNAIDKDSKQNRRIITKRR